MDGGVKYGGYEGHVYQSPPIDQDKQKVVTPPPPQPPHQFEENRAQYLAPPEPLDVKPQMPMAEKRDGGKELENGDGKGETNYPGATAESVIQRVLCAERPAAHRPRAPRLWRVFNDGRVRSRFGDFPPTE